MSTGGRCCEFLLFVCESKNYGRLIVNCSPAECARSEGETPDILNSRHLEVAQLNQRVTLYSSKFCTTLRFKGTFTLHSLTRPKNVIYFY